jgi:hypothetical protein
MIKKIFLFFVLMLILAGVLGYVYREPLLKNAADFMAPQGDYKADIVILEGSDYIHAGFVQVGMELLTAGKVKKIAVVIHRIAPAHRPFGINGDYPDAVRQKLLERGLKPGQFKIIVTPIRYPITMKEAQFALNDLAQEKISSAILVAPSYHTRRSYMAYSHVGETLKIKIYPLACFTINRDEKWWTDQGALRDLGAESVKLVYYLASGHLPFKFNY